MTRDGRPDNEILTIEDVAAYLRSLERVGALFRDAGKRH